MGGEGVKSQSTNKGKFLRSGGNRTGKEPAAPIDKALLKLHELAREGNLENFEAELETLRENNVDVDMKLQFVDNFKRQPLHLAAYFGHIEIVKRILEECPGSVSSMAVDGFLPAHFAAQQGHIEILKELVKGATTSSTGEAKFGAVRKLMQRTVKGNKSMLHLAAGKNHMEVVSFLIEKGCDIHMKNAQNKSPYELLSEESKEFMRSKLAALGVKEGSAAESDDNPSTSNVLANGEAGNGGAAGSSTAGGVVSNGSPKRSPKGSPKPGSSPRAASPRANGSPKAGSPKTVADQIPAAEAAYVEEEDDGGEELDAAAMEAKLAMLMAGGKKKKKKFKKRKREEEEDDAEGEEEEPDSKKANISNFGPADSVSSAPEASAADFSLDAILKGTYER